MNNLQRSILKRYLEDDSIDIYSISFIAGGNISKDSLSVNFYSKEYDEWFIFSVEIDSEGNETREKRTKVNR